MNCRLVCSLRSMYQSPHFLPFVMEYTENPAKRAANQRFVELMNEHAPMYQATDDSNKQDFLRNLLYNRIQARFVELITPATDEAPRVVVVDEEKIMKKMQSFIHRHHPGSNSVRSTTTIQPSPSSAAASLSFDMDSKEHFTDRHVQDKIDLRPLDIVCGKRAGTFHLREANQYYMWLAYDKLKDYDAAGDSKRDFSSRIVLELFQQGYRFMATFGKDDGFYEMTYSRSVEKLQQSFRDMRIRTAAPPKISAPHLKWISVQEKEQQAIVEPPNNGAGGPKKKPTTATAKQTSSASKKNKGMKSITSLAKQPVSSKPKRKASSLALYCHLEEEDVILGYGLKRKYAKRSSQLEFEGLLKQYVNRFELSSGLHQTILCREIANVTDERGGRFLRENKYRKFLQVPYDNAVEVIRQLLLDLAEDEEEMEHLEELDIQESDIVVGQNLSKGFQERSRYVRECVVSSSTSYVEVIGEVIISRLDHELFGVSAQSTIFLPSLSICFSALSTLHNYWRNMFLATRTVQFVCSKNCAESWRTAFTPKACAW